jgi:DNA helicase-2/ATP-dependent DNA helicase PcrA
VDNRGSVAARRGARGGHARAHQPADADAAEPRQGIDGRSLDADPVLDREDDTLLLRLHQRLRGPLTRGKRGREVLSYEHVFIDEAQDLSPVELAVVVDTLSPRRSLTLAGDVAQRLHLDNGFSDWKTVLGHLQLAHVQIEPLKLSYRSTQPIIDFAQRVLGPLACAERSAAIRPGVPVEVLGFAHSGEAAGFLAAALRELLRTEPRASVAVIARYPQQADLYYGGLRKAEIPRLRRIRHQDFPFRPGIDVTDVRQVKGLEFDYVALVEINDTSFPADDQSRHLLHIAATRAAHQLWLLTTSRPSPLLPAELLGRSY